MITDIFLGILTSLVQTLGGLFPDSQLGLVAGAQDISASVGGRLGPWDTILPISDLLLCLVILLSIWLPGVFTYVVVNWIYRHIPVFGGGG